MFCVPYVDLQVKDYVEDGNDTAYEPNIFEALKYGDEILNSSCYLMNIRSIDASKLSSTPFKTKIIGVQ